MQLAVAAGQTAPHVTRPHLRIVITAYVRFGNALAWHALELARGLHEAGHEIRFFCQRGSPLAGWSEGAPFPVNRDLNLNRANPASVWNGLAALRRTLREFCPDVLNPHCPPGHSYLAMARSLERMPIPLIRTVADPRSPNGNLLNARLHLRRTDGFLFTTSSSLRRYVTAFDLGTIPRKVILPGFRSDDFVAGVERGGYRQRFGLGEDQLLIGTVARMSPEKGQEVLLHALQSLDVEERRRVFCVLAGEDCRERGRADLERLARRLGVQSCVAFLGRLDDVRPLMAELDLAVVPSTRSEAVCRVALEYMSFGIPVIASEVNILPEVVRDGDNGWTFRNEDASALADCIRRALLSPTERRARGARGRQLVADSLSLRAETLATLDLFSEIIASHRRRQQ